MKADAFDEIHAQELQCALDDELQRLPERYRAVLVLCYLEGKSQREAAEELDCTDLAVKARLARGRRRLRMRLMRRGVALSLAVASFAGASAAAQQAVSAALVKTVASSCAASALANGGAMTCSKTALTLAQQGVRTMMIAYLAKPTLALLTIAAITLAGALTLQQIPAGAAPPAPTREIGLPADKVDGAATIAPGEVLALADDQNPDDQKSVERVDHDLKRIAAKIVELQSQVEYHKLRSEGLMLKSQAQELRMVAEGEADATKQAALLKEARTIEAKGEQLMLRSEAMLHNAQANELMRTIDLLSQELAELKKDP